MTTGMVALGMLVRGRGRCTCLALRQSLSSWSRRRRRRRRRDRRWVPDGCRRCGGAPGWLTRCSGCATGLLIAMLAGAR